MGTENKRGRKKKEIDRVFSERLTHLLQEAKTDYGTILEDVASEIGVSRQALGKWANGDTVPDILDLKKLAEYFQVSADYLLGISDVRTADKDLQSVCEYTGLSEGAVATLERLKGETSHEEVDSKPLICVVNNLLENEDFLYLVVDLNDLMCKSSILAYYYIRLSEEAENNFKRATEANSFAWWICAEMSILREKGKEAYEAYNRGDPIPDFDSKEDWCDLTRYKLAKVFEKICDEFDKRLVFKNFSARDWYNYFNLTAQEFKWVTDAADQLKKQMQILENDEACDFYHHQLEELIKKLDKEGDTKNG